MSTRVVAVDGPGGAGKTTYAEQLAAELGGVQIAHTDDFASWEDPVGWWPRCIAELLEPLARGEVARYDVTAWGGAERPPVEIHPAERVILEGVTASREAFRPYLFYSIWIETPRDLRLQRGLERDGEHMRDRWLAWMAAEDAYSERERPRERADVVVRGTRLL